MHKCHRHSESSIFNLLIASVHRYIYIYIIVQELCESRGGRLELSVLTSLLVSVDVKLF